MTGKFCIAICTICLSAAWKQKREKSRSASYFIISVLILLLTLSFTFREYIFQDGLGGDYRSYEEWFHAMNFSRLGFRFSNIGFDAIIVIIKLFTNNFHIFLFVCGLLINISIFHFISIHSKDVFFSSVLYVCFIYYLSFNILRQCMACAIYLLAFEFLMKKKPLNYTLIVVLAATIHTSAIFMLFLYPVINCRLSLAKKTFITAMVSLFSYISFDVVFNLILKFTETIGLEYAQKYRNAGNLDLGNYTPFLITLFISICLIYMYFNHMLDKKMQNYATWGILATGCSLLCPKNIIFNRMNVYLFISCIITFPIILKAFADSKSKYIFKIVMGSLALISFLL